MMTEIVADDIKEFIHARIDSIAQLEALLLLRTNSNEPWDVAKMARRLYVSERESEEALTRLCAEGLLSRSGNTTLPAPPALDAATIAAR
jgi:hypothetical protein